MSFEYSFVLVMTLLIVAFAAVRGGDPEKWCAGVIAGEILIDLLLYFALGPRTFGEFEPIRLTLDIAVAVAFITISLRANRLYPLGIAASQLVAIIGSVAVILVDDGMGQALWAMTQVPLFLQLGLLAAGTFAHSKRVARVGLYNCWSPRPG